MSEIIGGRRPVAEALASGRRAERLYLAASERRAGPELRRIVADARRLGIPTEEVDPSRIARLAGFDGHQGILLQVEDRRYSDVTEILARARARDQPPFVLILDSLQDPVNFGSLLRAAEAAGVHGVVFPEHRAAPLSAAAVKSSAGASEHLLLARVESLGTALRELQERGILIVAADQEAPARAWESDLRGPIAAVVGGEGSGISQATRKRCDLLVQFPMVGAVASLNAATAGSLLLFEIVRQRTLARGTGLVESAAGDPAPT